MSFFQCVFAFSIRVWFSNDWPVPPICDEGHGQKSIDGVYDFQESKLIVGADVKRVL